MSDSFDPGRVLREILTEHGPLPEADIERLLHTTGATDPHRVLRRLHLAIDVPTAQLSDDR